MPGEIDLLLPGLFNLPVEQAAALEGLPALARILRFARPLDNLAYSIDDNVAAMLQLPASEAGTRGLPVAWAQADDAQSEGLLLCEAVHLRADMQQALVLPIGREAPDLDDIRQLMADLAQTFAADFECSEVSGGVYLLRLRQVSVPRHYPHPLSVLGKPANPHVDADRSHLPWYRLQTEIQMYLHQHPVNARRQARDEAPINSLWFWGGGERIGPAGRRPAWFCAEPVLRRFGERLGLDCHEPDELARTSGDVAIVELRLLEWLKTGARQPLLPLLEEIELRWLAPALRRVERHNRRLRLRGASEFDYLLGRWSLRCFWRRPARAQARLAGITAEPG